MLTLSLFPIFVIYLVWAHTMKYQGSRSRCERSSLIWSRGAESWQVASSGISWVAVHGEGLICVVTKNQDLDNERIGPYLRYFSHKKIRLGFMRTIGHEMEDPSSELHQRFKQCAKTRSKMRPFAAISVCLGNDGVHQESGDETLIAGSGEQAAIRFLQEQLKNGSAFNYEETVQTAISALEHLHQEEFEATDILVSIWKKGNQYDKELHSKHVEEHLAVIRQKSTCSTSSWCPKKLELSADQCASTDVEVDDHFRSYSKRNISCEAAIL